MGIIDFLNVFPLRQSEVVSALHGFVVGHIDGVVIRVEELHVVVESVMAGLIDENQIAVATGLFRQVVLLSHAVGGKPEKFVVAESVEQANVFRESFIISEHFVNGLLRSLNQLVDGESRTVFLAIG